MTKDFTRRSILASALSTSALGILSAQSKRDWTGKDPVAYPDPDVVAVNPKRFKYKVGNAAIERVYTGCRFAEGRSWA